MRAIALLNGVSDEMGRRFVQHALNAQAHTARWKPICFYFSIFECFYFFYCSSTFLVFSQQQYYASTWTFPRMHYIKLSASKFFSSNFCLPRIIDIIISFHSEIQVLCTIHTLTRTIPNAIQFSVFQLRALNEVLPKCTQTRRNAFSKRRMWSL